MKDLEISEFGEPLKITLEDLVNLEKKFDIKLPNTYKEFAIQQLKYSRGTPGFSEFICNGKEGFNIIDETNRRNSFVVEQFHDLGSIYLLPKNDLSPLMGIAVDHVGNMLCISLSPNNYGKIYSWVMDEQPDECDIDNWDDDNQEDLVGIIFENIYFLCNDFNEFINRLEEE
jgi:hypothetical protein